MYVAAGVPRYFIGEYNNGQTYSVGINPRTYGFIQLWKWFGT